MLFSFFFSHYTEGVIIIQLYSLSSAAEGGLVSFRREQLPSAVITFTYLK